MSNIMLSSRSCHYNLKINGWARALRAGTGTNPYGMVRMGLAGGHGPPVYGLMVGMRLMGGLGGCRYFFVWKMLCWHWL